MIVSHLQGLKEDGIVVSLVKLSQWFEVPRCTVYYRAPRAVSKLQERFFKPINAMVEETPPIGYRTVAYLLDCNKHTLQGVFQLIGWQLRKRVVGFRPRIQALPSGAKAPHERWATVLCRVRAGHHGWASLPLVIDCLTQELLGWHQGRVKGANWLNRP